MRMAGPEVTVTGSPGDSDYVRVNHRGEVAVVTLDHQPDRNALSWAMTRALSGAVAAIPFLAPSWRAHQRRAARYRHRALPSCRAPPGIAQPKIGQQRPPVRSFARHRRPDH